MRRTRHIPKDAKATSISLTIAQQVAFQELQVARMKAGRVKPTLTDVMLFNNFLQTRKLQSEYIAVTIERDNFRMLISLHGIVAERLLHILNQTRLAGSICWQLR
jgi:hypothetical protein